MNRPIDVYSVVPSSTYNASFYYRVVLPLTTMAKMGLPMKPFIDGHSAQVAQQDRFQTMVGVDLHLLYQSVSPDILDLVKLSRTWPSMEDPDGGRLVPTSWICDTDDNLFSVSPFNPAFEGLGYRDNHGNELKKGDIIKIRNPITNQLEPLWHDGVNVDYEKNREKLNIWRETMQESELITTSTPILRDRMIKEIGVEHGHKFHVHPNCIDFSEYPNIELRDHPDEIRILWQGSQTHWEDLWDIREAIGRISKKYPQVKFVFWGASYKWLADYLDADKVLFLPWQDYRSYKIRLGTINHDINLAPLKPSVFSECRSAIKFYESAAICKPAPTLAQGGGPYEEIIHGETGLLYNTMDEFEERLSGLIEDETLRRTLASNAKDWVRTNRDPETHCKILFEKYNKVRDDRLTWPEPEVNNGVLETEQPDVVSSGNESLQVCGDNG